MRRVRQVGFQIALGIGVFAAGYGLGVMSYRHGWPPISAYRRLTAPSPAYLTDLSGRRDVPCPSAGPRTAVLLALGQSNAANLGLARQTPITGAPTVTNFFDGKCYAAGDSLLGAEGGSSSVWTLVGNDLVADGAFTDVVLAVFAIGNTSIADWNGTPFFQRRLDRIVSDLQSRRLPPTMVLWFQGERDGQDHTEGAAYVSAFESFARGLRARGVTAPIYLSLTTLCQSPPNPGIRSAQRTLQQRQGFAAGPDTDSVGLAYRWDGCHFTPEGQARVATLWADALRRRD